MTDKNSNELDHFKNKLTLQRSVSGVCDLGSLLESCKLDEVDEISENYESPIKRRRLSEEEDYSVEKVCPLADNKPDVKRKWANEVHKKMAEKVSYGRLGRQNISF